MMLPGNSGTAPRVLPAKPSDPNGGGRSRSRSTHPIEAVSASAAAVLAVLGLFFITSISLSSDYRSSIQQFLSSDAVGSLETTSAVDTSSTQEDRDTTEDGAADAPVLQDFTGEMSGGENLAEGIELQRSRMLAAVEEIFVIKQALFDGAAGEFSEDLQAELDEMTKEILVHDGYSQGCASNAATPSNYPAAQPGEVNFFFAADAQGSPQSLTSFFLAKPTFEGVHVNLDARGIARVKLPAGLYAVMINEKQISLLVHTDGSSWMPGKDTDPRGYLVLESEEADRCEQE
jgi:hypothetical protein